MWDNTSGIHILTRPVSLLADGSIIYDLWPQQTVDHRSVYWNRFTSNQLLCQMTDINGILNGHDHRCIIPFTPVGRNTMPCGPHNPGARWYPLTLLNFQWAIQTNETHCQDHMQNLHVTRLCMSSLTNHTAIQLIIGEMIIDNAMITILLTVESYQIHIAFRLSSDICQILPWCLGVIGITLINKMFSEIPDNIYSWFRDQVLLT